MRACVHAGEPACALVDHKPVYCGFFSVRYFVSFLHVLVCEVILCTFVRIREVISYVHLCENVRMCACLYVHVCA